MSPRMLRSRKTIVTLLAGAILGILATTGLVDSHRNTRLEAEQAGTDLTGALIAPVSAALARGDSAGLGSLLCGRLEDPRLAFAIVRNADGLPFAESCRPGFDMIQAKAQIIRTAWSPEAARQDLVNLRDGTELVICSLPLESGGLIHLGLVVSRPAAHLTMPRPGGWTRSRLTSYSTKSDSAAAAFERADESRRRIHRKEAIAGYLRAIAFDSTFAIPHMFMATMTEQGGEHEEALRWVDKALVLSGNATEWEQIWIRHTWATIHNDRRARELAQADMFEKYPDEIFVRWIRANRLQNLGRYEDAALEWERFLDQDPDNPLVYNQRGYVLAMMGRYPEALESIRRYAFLVPGQCNPHDSLGDILFGLGRYDEARHECETALALKPDFYHSDVQLATIDLEMGRYVPAMHRLETLAGGDRSPAERTDLTERMALIEITRGRPARAINLIETARADTLWGRVHYWKGLADVALGRLDEANLEADHLLASLKKDYAAMEMITSLAVEDPFYRLLLGRIHEAEGSTDLAWLNYREALGTGHIYDADYFVYQQREPRLALARLALRQDRPEDALAEMNELLQVVPNHPEALLLSGRALARLNRTGEARSRLEHGLTLLAGSDAVEQMRAAEDLLHALDRGGATARRVSARMP